MNFNNLGLKKLIATCYSGVFEIAHTAYKIVIAEVNDGIDISIENLLKNSKNELMQLKGDGDFHSEECTELLKESDIVVTNPPFSFFREFLA